MVAACYSGHHKSFLIDLLTEESRYGVCLWCSLVVRDGVHTFTRITVVELIVRVRHLVSPGRSAVADDG